MAKDKYEDYSSTEASNTDVGGVNIQGSASIANGDNALRELMTHTADHFAQATISDSATPDLGANAAHYLIVAGTTTQTSYGTVKAGTVKFVEYSGARQLTHNATSFILPGAVNITTVAGDTAIWVSEGSGNWRCLSYHRASGRPVVPTLRGHIFGLTTSNNSTDTEHDIDIAAGVCASDSTVPVEMTLASAITKRIDASWAVGTGNGGLDGTESVAGTPDVSTWYAIWLIKRSDTGVVDALFSESFVSPTMPANYDYKRRIGAVRTDGSANIYAFLQTGDQFQWKDTFEDVSANAAGTSAVLRSISVPPGIKALANLSIRAAFGASGIAVIVTDPNCDDIAPSGSQAQLSTGLSNGSISTMAWVRTDTSQQIRTRQSQGGASETLTMSTFGWIDERGRFA